MSVPEPASNFEIGAGEVFVGPNIDRRTNKELDGWRLCAGCFGGETNCTEATSARLREMAAWATAWADYLDAEIRGDRR